MQETGDGTHRPEFERGNRAPTLRRRGDRDGESWGRAVKRAVLHVCAWLGLFALARRLTKRQLRILCYHGFALDDEAEFRPGLFISLATFARRLDDLIRSGFKVMKLEDAVNALESGHLPDMAAVITIDDGFYGTCRAVRSELVPRCLPATIFVTSYYAQKQTPIFRLMVAYMFWKTEAVELDLGALAQGWSGKMSVSDREAVESAMQRIIEYGEKRLDESGRGRLGRLLGQLLGVDYDQIAASRRFNLLNQAELSELDALGVDIQLHTHRHRLGFSQAEAVRELDENRSWLRTAVRSSLDHFCYPSGDVSPEHLPWLAAYGIKSAVTCQVGLNREHAPRLALRRWLDDERVSRIEFEAEMSGFLELSRRLKTWLRRREASRTRQPGPETPRNTLSAQSESAAPNLAAPR